MSDGAAPDPPPSTIVPRVDHDTGVSNGDVDWLFRGKSKKLTKKMNLDKDQRETKEEQKETTNAKDASPSADEVEKERSKLDKLRIGRSRLSLASSVGDTDTTEAAATNPAGSAVPQRRRSSLSFISAAAGGTIDPDTPPAGVVRSNSNGKSKSLFSSFSLKFKQPTPPAAPVASSPTSASPIAPKRKDASLVGSTTNPSEKQDLASFINKPLAGVGIPINIKRKGSMSSSVDSRDSLVEKERWFFKGRRDSERRPSVAETPEERVVYNKNPNRKAPFKELNGVVLRRVNFAIDKLEYDPQQQIPSRRPKKGNVLVPEDLTAPLPRLSQGISVANAEKATLEVKYSEKELAMAVEAQRRALLEAEKHAYEAHLSAKRIANEVAQYKAKTSAKEEENEPDHDVEAIAIDKPLHVHENHFNEEHVSGVKELSLETIYTRCCHLREILPIPATLKQLKNKSQPLEVLKLLNPRPTLIDVLSFSDFIALVPINTVIFDNVTMTTEMLRHLLASLVHNKQLEKLSLRNVPIDDLGWKYLCKFLSRNTSVKKLDISQQRIRSDTPKSSIRSSMDWDLLIRAIVARGGIEELVINGCKLLDETFRDLIRNAVSLSTYRLGVASCELNLFKAQTITDWIAAPNSKCMGVDVAFNDLSQGQLRPFIDTFKTGKARLVFFSLNSTKLHDVNEMLELLESLINIDTLRFLDLSSLPALFPGIISSLNKYLPRFPFIKRIHFDLNELSSQAIGAIADILPKVKTLVHVSFIGNRNITHGCAAVLYSAVKQSLSLFTLDLDYDLIPDLLSQKIAFYLMRNMDHEVTLTYSNEEELMFDGSLLMETAEKIMKEQDEHASSQNHDLKVQKIITNAFIERTRLVRLDIHRAIDDLFEKRNKGLLSFDGKENLIRFCLLDASLEKVVHMYEEKAKLFEETPVELPPDFHDQLHESSTELITAGPILSPHNTTFDKQSCFFQNIDPTLQPHQVVIESLSDGTNVPVDHLTGRPVLIRSISQTSTHAKEQEKEEGELHRWGFFMQQRNNDQKQVPMLNVLPLGSELREAIITAKGIESVTDLISRISNDRDIEQIYNLENVKRLVESEADDTALIDLAEDCGVNAVVDEVYEKLLNDAERVRSNK